MTNFLCGSFAFGLVVGWIAYRTLRRSATSGLSDIATVIGAVGGGAVTALFPAGSDAFGAYAIGLAVGFFAYLVTAVVIAGKTSGLSPVGEWLGTSDPAATPPARRPPTDTVSPDPMPPIPE
jgi:hypothetical protein